VRYRGIGLVAAAAVALLSGCGTPQVHHVTMDASHLVGAAQVRVACSYRITEIVDERPAGDRAGGLGWHMFVLGDVVPIVKEQLLAAGMSETDGIPVQLRVLKIYLSQNAVTKIPVVVYKVAIDGQPTALVRSQRSTMNWNGTENEAYAAYAMAMQDATTQVVRQLNRACGQASASRDEK
jgi:hypothetical protein